MRPGSEHSLRLRRKRVLGMADVELIKKMHEREHSIREIARMTGRSR
jgi:predicted transcriptional regulator